MPADSIARRLILAARATDYRGLWTAMVLKSPKARANPQTRSMVSFVESRYGREPLARDLPQIMARALNALFGDGAAQAATEGKILLDSARAHDVLDEFQEKPSSEEEEARSFERLWGALTKAADAHMRERYGAVPRAADTPAPPPVEDSAPQPGHGQQQDERRREPEVPEPLSGGRDYAGELALVANDAGLWHHYMQFDEADRPHWEGVAEDPGQLLVVRVGRPGFVEQGRRQSVEAKIGQPVDGLPVLVGKDRLRLPDGTVVPVAPGQRHQPERTSPPPEQGRERPRREPPRREPPRREPAPQRVSDDTLDKMAHARGLVSELMSIDPGSVEDATGVRLEPWKVRAVYDELDGVLSEHGAPPAPEPRDTRAYVPGDDELLGRLYLRLHRVLGARRELEAAGVNAVSLKYLMRDLAEIRAGRSASCDVLQRGALTDMRSAEGDSMRVCGGCDRAARIAADLLRKQAIQLSKGNMRATQEGTITIDPGFMNCPVVRAVIRDLDTKASDMEALRRRLDDMGMIVTQGNHGQGQVYCLVRTEGGGGAKTRMCQWFIDAHGADGKFKIECAKD